MATAGVDLVRGWGSDRREGEARMHKLLCNTPVIVDTARFRADSAQGV